MAVALSNESFPDKKNIGILLAGVFKRLFFIEKAPDDVVSNVLAKVRAIVSEAK